MAACWGWWLVVALLLAVGGVWGLIGAVLGFTALVAAVLLVALSYRAE